MAPATTVERVDHLSQAERECIETCNEAAGTSEWCADECLGEEEMAECARLCRDVADIASLHARLLARDSTNSGHLAGVCAAVCDARTEECRQHDRDHCQVTAEVLEDCAESCRQMTRPGARHRPGARPFRAVRIVRITATGPGTVRIPGRGGDPTLSPRCRDVDGRTSTHRPDGDR